MRQWKIAILATVALACAAIVHGLRAQPGTSVFCKAESHAGSPYTICAIDLRKHQLRLFLKDPDGKTFGSFRALDAWLGRRGETLAFAMNAGMYHADRSPVGLFVENGVTHAALNVADGPGNFFMKPNGVFFIAGKSARVMETDTYLREKPAADLATQSGPMLLSAGRIHPRFIKGSTSRKIRNGVCVVDESRVIFAISGQQVSFHAFAELFRARLKCDDALYLDGTISGLHAPGLGRSDATVQFGPIIAVVE